MKTINIKVELTEEEYEMLQKVYKNFSNFEKINDSNFSHEESQILEALYYKGLLWFDDTDWGRIYSENFEESQIELLK
jgi:hypothetical protein